MFGKKYDIPRADAVRKIRHSGKGKAHCIPFHEIDQHGSVDGKRDPEINQGADKRLPYANPPLHQENHTGRKQKERNHVKGYSVGVHAKPEENHGQIQPALSTKEKPGRRTPGFLCRLRRGSSHQKIQAQQKQMRKRITVNRPPALHEMPGIHRKKGKDTDSGPG